MGFCFNPYNKAGNAYTGYFVMYWATKNILIQCTFNTMLCYRKTNPD